MYRGPGFESDCGVCVAACQALSYITELISPQSTARPFSVEALRLWNRLPFKIRTAESLQIFGARR